MSLPQLTCGGARLALGDRIGRGGEGEVFALAQHPSRAIKIYLRPDAAREAKIRAMLKAGLGDICPNVAFPIHIVHDAKGKFAGFVMARVHDHEPIHELLTPGSRRQFFPQADWRFLVRVALNVARIVASVHATGAVVGDINSAGFLVSRKATVTLIDADSFQVAGHRCSVGMAEYTPPELQGVRLSEVDRTEDHDAFGLAVLLFQILALGRHPFAGVAQGRPVPLDTAIRMGRFAYSQMRDTSMKSPPAALTLANLPCGVSLLFERAFAPRNGPRPSPADWVRELSYLEGDLAPCPANPAHFVATFTASCPWCRIERATGQPTFENSTVRRESPSEPSRVAVQQEVERVIRQARRHANETIEPAWPRAQCTASLRATHSTTKSQFVARHAAACVEASRAIDGWRTRLGIWEVKKEVSALREGLARLANDISALPFLLKRMAAGERAERVEGMLRQVGIGRDLVTGIGESLRRLLLGHGIRSAADVTRPALAAVPGLGDSRTFSLLLWRAGLEAQAQRAATPSAREEAQAAAANRRRLDAEIRRREEDLLTQARKLEARARDIRARSAMLDADVDKALRERDQAIADLDDVGIDQQTAAASFAQKAFEAALKQAGNTAQAPSKPKKNKKKAKRTNKSCPRCGAAMVKRWGQASGTSFFGCSGYPLCGGTRPGRKKSASP
ncbi:helix-hairpin-helix DNA-binding domain containing protein kinase [Sphingomonas paucimobilis]|nr:helix-hairpin-helix DNA-binding domain containing protein kinase [Sphingomonas paucimobilis]